MVCYWFNALALYDYYVLFITTIICFWFMENSHLKTSLSFTLWLKSSLSPVYTVYLLFKDCWCKQLIITSRALKTLNYAYKINATWLTFSIEFEPCKSHDSQIEATFYGFLLIKMPDIAWMTVFFSNLKVDQNMLLLKGRG